MTSTSAPSPAATMDEIRATQARRRAAQKAEGEGTCWFDDHIAALLSLLQQTTREVTKNALARAMHEESEDRHSLPYKWEEITTECQARWEDRAARIISRLPRPVVSLVEG